jgi:hypothetical protein
VYWHVRIRLLVFQHIPKDWAAAQECVGGDTKGPKLAAATPVAKVWAAVNVEARTQATKQNQQAPIKMVSGHVWSQGIYWALGLLKKALDVAWERVFICSLTFNY